LNVVYLIEEPETFLHPSAQNDLLNAFRDLSEENQAIITTHSPVFAGATHIESVILCKKGDGSIYEHHGMYGQEAFIEKIVDELGIKPSYNLGSVQSLVKRLLWRLDTFTAMRSLIFLGNLRKFY